MKELEQILVPFNSPSLLGDEITHISEALADKHHSSDGRFTKLCHAFLKKLVGSERALLCNSGTSALDFAALLADVKAGDEIIMPPFTFISTASAFVLRGAKPVFVDIKESDLNLDESKIEAAISPRTRAIVPVHYAGILCEMNALMGICKAHNLLLIEDAAHAIGSSYEGKAAGSFGDFSIFSFHAAKNISCGEGGAIVVNNSSYAERGLMLWDKGSNKRQFMQGQLNHYSWQLPSSSFAPSEITAAFLYSQFLHFDEIISERICLWQRYYENLSALESQGFCRRPVVSQKVKHNAHIFYILLESEEKRKMLIDYLGKRGITALFHYIPLHLSEAGKGYCGNSGSLSVAEEMSTRILRLPLWFGMKDEQIDYVSECISDFFLT